MATIKEELLGRAMHLEDMAKRSRAQAEQLRQDAGEAHAEADRAELRAEEYRALAEKA